MFNRQLLNDEEYKNVLIRMMGLNSWKEYTDYHINLHRKIRETPYKYNLTIFNSDCNKACPFCAFLENKDYVPANYDFNKIDKIVSDYSIRNFTYTGGEFFWDKGQIDAFTRYVDCFDGIMEVDTNGEIVPPEGFLDKFGKYMRLVITPHDGFFQKEYLNPNIGEIVIKLNLWTLEDSFRIIDSLPKWPNLYVCPFSLCRWDQDTYNEDNSVVFDIDLDEFYNKYHGSGIKFINCKQNANILRELAYPVIDNSYTIFFKNNKEFLTKGDTFVIQEGCAICDSNSLDECYEKIRAHGCKIEIFEKCLECPYLATCDDTMYSNLCLIPKSCYLLDCTHTKRMEQLVHLLQYDYAGVDLTKSLYYNMNKYKKLGLE